MATYRQTFNTEDNDASLDVWDGVSVWNLIYNFTGGDVVVQQITGSPLVVTRADFDQEVAQVVIWFDTIKKLLNVSYPARQASSSKIQKTSTSIVGVFELAPGDEVFDATYVDSTKNITFQVRTNKTLNPSTWKYCEEFLRDFIDQCNSF